MQYCTNEQYQSSVTKLFSADNMWPKYAPHFMGTLAEHEWERHGVCFSPSNPNSSSRDLQVKFFQFAHEVFDTFGQTPANFQNVIGTSMSFDEIKKILKHPSDADGKGILLACQKGPDGWYLNMVSHCVSKDGQHIIDCPQQTIDDHGYANSCFNRDDIDILSWAQVSNAN
jgi:ribonuclease I